MYLPEPWALSEVVGEKYFGSFEITSVPFDEEFTATWRSADGKKEMETVFTPSPK